MELRSFFKNIAYISLIIAVIIGSIFFSVQPDQESYFYGSQLKLNLLKTMPSPKIIIFGGSNVAFGIDSELIEQEFGIPVINDGLNAGLSLLPLEELKHYINKGDIVIISIEYVIFTFYENGNPQEISDWIEYAPERMGYLPNPIRQAPSVYGIMLQRKVNRQLNYYLYNKTLEPIRGIYTGSDFNKRGDFIGHLHLADYEPPEIGSSPYPVNPSDTINAFLFEFNQIAISKGVRVFFESQPNRQTNCEATPEQRLKKFYRELQEATGLPVITNMDQLCLPDEYFFDTAYHLNATGREIRTQRLIRNLKNALEN
ncbi:MAG: hypothetical protein AB8I58_23895 [Anaerolineales bacterium]